MSGSDRFIFLDTETTGLDPKQGHRIIEIGCVEMRNRRLTGEVFHHYVNPEREIEAAASAVHGITSHDLIHKPKFSTIIETFLKFVEGSTLIIHNAPFDIGFLNHELRLQDSNCLLVTEYCEVIDTLMLARKMHPGQKNSLDALCKRYNVNNKHRNLHGALLDANILSQVYLAMTGGQSTLAWGDHATVNNEENVQLKVNKNKRVYKLPVQHATDAEIKAHDAMMELVGK